MKEQISVFDILKIGVGPSSSHTLGPWRAAQRFVSQLDAQGDLSAVEGIKVFLYGSLAKTGVGHGTNIAVALGINGEDPVTVDVNKITPLIENLKKEGRISLGGKATVPFNYSQDIVFMMQESLPYHPNALTFQAFLASGKAVSETYYSIGGGFVVQQGEENTASKQVDLPFPIENAKELQGWCKRTGLKISEVVLENETAWRSEQETHERLLEIHKIMAECTYRGCHTTGVLPGG